MVLRIATYNIHRCVGCDGLEAPERIAAVLQDIKADVAALQEVAFDPSSPKKYSGGPGPVYGCPGHRGTDPA
jgi:endonuclease/exonuclease/phosphatase family metal-dependent hydrolase